MIYFDSCYIAKFYLAEPDSSRVIGFAQSHPNVACLLLGKAEVLAVFHRKFRENAVDSKGYALLCDQFELDCAQGLWHWQPLDDALLSAAGKRLRALPSSLYIRSADALHLTCAAERGFAAIHTSDRHMLAAAPTFGLLPVAL